MTPIVPRVKADHADGMLMRRIALGDAAAMGTLVQSHWRDLVQYTSRLLNDRDRASDVVQQAFATLWERRGRWKPRGSVRAYLFRIVRNGAIDELRWGAVRSFWNERIGRATPPPPTPHEVTVRNELHDALARAIDALPRRRREILVLAHLHGLSHQEIADLLSLSPETVKKHVSLALGDLRRQLSPCFSEAIARPDAASGDSA
ncbi:MAG: sigma-70 family RNA polymerase sigma factor [Cytophagaceae bacterium]|nr:sigma-70 family RNA polymerase sigma factor [Gemmatimonadaceae bacterium]